VLHFKEPHKSFLGFGDSATQQRFAGLMGSMTMDWCCRSDRMLSKGLTQGHLLQMRPFGSPTASLCQTAYDAKNSTVFCDGSQQQAAQAQQQQQVQLQR
jgi:hypothetical protein